MLQAPLPQEQVPSPSSHTRDHPALCRRGRETRDGPQPCCTPASQGSGLGDPHGGRAAEDQAAVLVTGIIPACVLEATDDTPSLCVASEKPTAHLSAVSPRAPPGPCPASPSQQLPAKRSLDPELTWSFIECGLWLG